MWTCKQGCKLKSVVWNICASASADYRLPADLKEWWTVQPLGRAIRGSRRYDEHPEQDGPVCEVCYKKSQAHFEKHGRFIQGDVPGWTYMLEWVEE